MDYRNIDSRDNRLSSVPPPPAKYSCFFTPNLMIVEGEKMIKIRFRTFVMVAFVAMVGVLFSSCVSTSSHPQKDMDKMKDNIVYELAESASVSKVSYFYEDYKGSPTLHFEVDIKNISQVAHRYRLNILLPQGPAVGGMYPRKKKAIEPGETLTRKFPVYIDSNKLPSNFMPTGFTLVVKEL